MCSKVDFFADSFAIPRSKLRHEESCKQTDVFLIIKQKEYTACQWHLYTPICPEFSQGLVAKFIKKDTLLGLFYWAKLEDFLVIFFASC